MIEIERAGWKYGGTYTVYESEKEAREAGLDPIPCRDVVRAGQWGISTDGYVQEALSVREYRRQDGEEARQITYPVGRVWSNSAADFLVERFLETGKYSRTNPDWHWADAESRRQRTQVAVLLYVRYLVAGISVDWELVGRAYRPDLQHPSSIARKLFRQDQIVEMVRQEIRKVFSKHGLDEEAVARGYADLLVDGDEKTRLQVLKEVSKLLGMDDADRRGGLTVPHGVGLPAPGQIALPEPFEKEEIQVPELLASWEED